VALPTDLPAVALARCLAVAGHAGSVAVRRGAVGPAQQGTDSVGELDIRRVEQRDGAVGGQQRTEQHGVGAFLASVQRAGGARPSTASCSRASALLNRSSSSRRAVVRWENTASSIACCSASADVPSARPPVSSCTICELRSPPACSSNADIACASPEMRTSSGLCRATMTSSSWATSAALCCQESSTRAWYRRCDQPPLGTLCSISFVPRGAVGVQPLGEGAESERCPGRCCHARAIDVMLET